jgi:sulfate adenylyltransferase (ADP) / ATP adenylyltransferase
MVQDHPSPPQTQWLQTGTLWPKIRLQTQHALNCGALRPIPTTYDWVEQNGIRFVVRILANLQRKVAAKESQPKNFNPFLPYDTNLFVTDLSPTHLVLLNKFNVMDHHLLIVTREFASQDDFLTAQDFQSLALGLSEVDGLAFYNGGPKAGASQPHKHMQIVPLPFVPDGSRLPIESLLLENTVSAQAGVNPRLPFLHLVTRFENLDFTQPKTLSMDLLEAYRHLMISLNLMSIDSTKCAPGAYNLLMTREWMCIVPRSQESFGEIQINALGFAGALLVRNPAQLTYLQKVGPLTVLQEVGCPA